MQLKKSKKLAKGPLKALLLITIPLMFAGTFILFDLPQSMEEPLIKTFQISTVSVVSLYSISASTTVAMDLAMIPLLDKFSLGRCAALFQAVFCLGVVCTHLGLSVKKFSFVVLGRLLFGIGMECLYVVQNIAAERWFRGRMLVIVCGLAPLLVMLFNSVTAFLLPLVFVESGGNWWAVMGVVEVFAGVVFGLSLVFWWVDENCAVEGGSEYERYPEGAEGVDDDAFELRVVSSCLDSSDFDENHDLAKNVSLTGFEQKVDKETKEASNKLDSLLLTSEASPVFKKRQKVAKKAKPEKTSQFTLTHLKHIPTLSWALLAFSTTSVTCYFQLTNIATDLIATRFSLPYLTAKNASASISFVNMIFMPICIYSASKYGRRTHAYLIGSFLYLVCFVSLLTSKSDKTKIWHVYRSLGALAIGNALILSSVVAGLLLTIPTKSTRFIVPIMAIGFNLPSVVASPLMGWISRARTVAAYQNCLYLLLGFGLVNFLVSFWVFGLNRGERVKGLLDLAGDDKWVTEYKERLNQEVDRLIRGAEGVDEYQAK